MKFGFKLFIVSFLLIIISFGAGGFILVNSFFTDTLDRQIDADKNTAEYITASLYALVENSESLSYDESLMRLTIENFKSQVVGRRGASEVHISGLFNVPFYGEQSFVNELESGEIAYDIIRDGEVNILETVSCIKIMGQDYYVSVYTELEPIYAQRDRYLEIYQTVLFCVALVASAVMGVFSFYITKPLGRLTKVTREIASGKLGIRVGFTERTAGSKEILELSESFDTMAQSLENQMNALKEEAERRDDFVGAFTHELKTPLTSIIGYSDMLRSYDLDANKRRECAECIYREGKRLEGLSISLLDLMVLKNRGVNREEISTEVIMSEVVASLAFLEEKYGVSLCASFDSAVVLGEYSLVKTLLYNLVDNALKASQKGAEVRLSGRVEGDKYRFAVEDFGCGIPEDELARITEPFYMVDKSRARKMGGAGLGLSLCKEILLLHESELIITSEAGKGTKVSFCLVIKEELKNED